MAYMPKGRGIKPRAFGRGGTSEKKRPGQATNKVQQVQATQRSDKTKFQDKIASLNKRFGELTKKRRPFSGQSFSSARNQNAGMPTQIPKGPRSTSRMSAPRGMKGTSFSGNPRTRGFASADRFQPGDAPSIRNRGGARPGTRKRGSGGSRRMGTPGAGNVLTGRRRKRF